jgi:hypothetical protein
MFASACISIVLRCRAWISRRFLNNQGPDRTHTRICTSSLFADAGEVLGLSARCVVGLIVEAGGMQGGVNYLVGVLVTFLNDGARSIGKRLQVSDKAET